MSFPRFKAETPISHLLSQRKSTNWPKFPSITAHHKTEFVLFHLVQFHAMSALPGNSESKIEAKA